MMTRVFQAEEVKEAAKYLIEGETVIFPTETVYGIGARFDCESALQKIFQAKNRPSDNPLIVHICSREQIGEVALEFSSKAWKLAGAFWPGPLTIVVKKKEGLPSLLSAGLDTVAIRWPSHPVALKLLEAVGVPVAAPSANLSGTPSPTRAEHLKQMMGRVSAIVEGDATPIGIESTVISLVEDEPILLRPGKITRVELEKVLGEKVRSYKKEEARRSPGLLHRHYAPKTPVKVLRGEGKKLEEFIKEHPKSVFLLSPEDSKLLAYPNTRLLYECEENDYGSHNLFHYLYVLDEEFYDIIYIKDLPQGPQTEAIRDRILRSAGGSIIELEEC